VKHDKVAWQQHGFRISKVLSEETINIDWNVLHDMADFTAP